MGSCFSRPKVPVTRAPQRPAQRPKRPTANRLRYVPAAQNALGQQVERAIFFEEGPGFLFIQKLGSGVDGSASLVRNVDTGGLKVRKEAFRAQGAHSNEIGIPPWEAQVASLVKHIDGVYQAQGWTNWLYTKSRQIGVVEVTYWRYCNMGALSSFEKSARHKIPEVFICHWLRSMLATLIDVHKAGIVHNDAHWGNWLLHKREESPIPDIVLADFGRAESNRGMRWSQWISRCAGDFELVIHNIADVLCLVEVHSIYVRLPMSQCSMALLHILRDLLNFLTDPPDSLVRIHEEIYYVRDDLRKQITKAHAFRAIPCQVGKPRQFAEFEQASAIVQRDRKAFKRYRIADVTPPAPGRQGCVIVKDGLSPGVLRVMANVEDGYSPRRADGGKYEVIHERRR